jgi:hypothetical protein
VRPASFRSAIAVLFALAAVLLPAAGASAADPFYAAPSPLPHGAPGALIRTRPAAITLPGAQPFTATTVMYHSRTATGGDEAVTGTVLTPTAPWTGPGPRPYVSFAVGTQGLGKSCAPSRQLVAGTEYESGNLALALDRGWGVVVTDYDGYVDGATPTYTVGPAMAHAVLDIVRAARSVPSAGLESSTPLVIWGYSQGGGGSAWATVLQPAYAPELHLVAAAAGGIPADVKAVGDSLDGGATESLLLDAIIGLDSAYPKAIQLASHVNAAGAAVTAELEQECVGGPATATTAFHHVSDYTNDGETLAQLEAPPAVQSVLAANDLITKAAPRVPIYQYHGAADEIVPLAQAQQLHRAWCAEGVRTRMDLYPGDHVTAAVEGAPAALTWLSNALAGQPNLTSCLT